MFTTVSKTFRWEMGHRLMDHPGLCRHLHGHSYKAVVSVTGELDDSGMVLDFADIKAALQPLVDELDHSMMLSSADGELVSYLRGQEMKLYVLPCEPTAENIAGLIAGRAVTAFSGDRRLKTVRVQVIETETSSATAEVAL